MEITRIEMGEIITKPGFYDIPISWYHSNCCDGPSVSSSGLRTLELKSPLHFYDDSYFNPDRPEEDPTEEEKVHFRIGRAGHYLLLEPEKYTAEFSIRPAEYDSYRSKNAKLWRDAVQSQGRTPLSPAEEERAKGIASAMRRHNLHGDGLLGGAVEVSMIVRDAKTGLWLKSRPDSIPVSGANADLKITRDAAPKAMGKMIRTLGYDMQAELSNICWQKLTDHTNDANYIVGIESARPHAIHIASLSVATLYWARIRLRHAIDTMAKCLADDHWPGFDTDDGKPVEPSPYDVEVWEQFQKSSLLPKDAEF